jgi:glycerol uptake facilitator-like aquaporin
VTAFVAWLAALHSNEQTSGLALASPASALTLAAVRRMPASNLLPLFAAQVVGAVTAGFAALALDSQLGGALTWTDPSPIAVGVGVGFLGLLASWTVLAIDGGENVAWSGLGPVATAAALGVGLATALNPAALIGLATAGIVGWVTAGVGAVAGLLAAFVGAYVIGILTPAEAEVA